MALHSYILHSYAAKAAAIIDAVLLQPA
jgi:hypothetical protein